MTAIPSKADLRTAALAKREDELSADDLHGIMRINEARSIRMNAEIMATAAAARKETRTRSAHRRMDYPEADDENWRKFAVVEQGPEGRPRVRAVDASQPLASVFARNSQGLSERRPHHAASS